MPTHDVLALDQAVEKTNAWLKELGDELGKPGDRRYALRVLKAFLHTLRDRIPVEQSAHVAAQLPELVRGIYYEAWRPSTVPQKYHDLPEFLDRVAQAGLLAGETEAAYAVEACVRLLHRHLSPDELDNVASVLPPSIAAVVGRRASAGTPTS